MEENYKISVVMPCYNVEDYVEETLQSLFTQTFQDFEIICIDDGSTDGTLAVLERIGRERKNMRVIPETNHRQGYERNKGIELSVGKYIYYMDSDDLLAENCFEVIYHYAEKKQLDLLFFEADSFYETEQLEKDFPQYKTLYHRKKEYTEDYTGEELYTVLRANGDMMVSPCLQLVRRDFLMKENIRFPELPLMEDNLYSFYCTLAAKKAGCITDRLYHRRVRASSTMTAVQNEARAYALEFTLCKMLEKSEEYLDKPEVLEAIQNHVLGVVRQISNIYQNNSLEKNREISSKMREVSLKEILPCFVMLDLKYKKTVQDKNKLAKENKELKSKLKAANTKKANLKKKVNALEKKTERQSEKLQNKTEKVKELREKLAGLNSRFLVKVSHKLHGE